jgi:hypothetical protein
MIHSDSDEERFLMIGERVGGGINNYCAFLFIFQPGTHLAPAHIFINMEVEIVFCLFKWSKVMICLEKIYLIASCTHRYFKHKGYRSKWQHLPFSSRFSVSMYCITHCTGLLMLILYTCSKSLGVTLFLH